MSPNQPISPFSSQFPAQAAKSGNNKGCLIAILVMLGLIMLCVILAIAAATVALNRTGVIGNSDVPSPETFELDSQSYLDSLSSRLNQEPVDNEILTWVDEQLSDVDSYQQDHQVDFSENMFLQAVGKSKFATNIGFVERTMIRISLSTEVQRPNVLSGYTVLRTSRVDSNEAYQGKNFASVDILFYEQYSQSICSRWYLVQEDDQWRLYDWQTLEHGRRHSDQFAITFSHLDDDGVDGLNESHYAAYETYANYGDEKSSEQILKEMQAAEQINVLPEDEGLRDLYVASCYEAIGHPEEALRLIQSIDETTLRWGRLSAEAFALLRIGRYQDALDVADSLLDDAPNHPNGLEVKSQALFYLDRDAEARPFLLRLLKLCPANEMFFDQLLDVASPEDFADLLAIAQNLPDKGLFLNKIISAASSPDDPTPAYLANWQDLKREDLGVPSSFWFCLEAASNKSAPLSEPVITQLQVIAIDDNDPFQFAARQQLTTYWINNREYDKLINLTTPEEFLENALIDFYANEEGPFADLDSGLLEALQATEPLRNLPVLDLVRGIYYHQSEPEIAETALHRYLSAIPFDSDQLDGQLRADDADEVESTVESFGPEWATEMLVRLYMRSNRVLEILEKFGINSITVAPISQHYTVSPDSPGLIQAVALIEAADAELYSRELAEMRAAHAFVNGSADELDKAIDEAISASSMGADSDYFTKVRLQAIVKRRVIYAILDGDLSRLENWKVSDDVNRQYCRNECLMALAGQAFGRRNVALMDACEQFQSSWKVEDPETLATIAIHKINLGLSLEDSSKGLIIPVSLALKNENAYRLRWLATESLKRLIEIGQTDDACALLEVLDESQYSLQTVDYDLFNAAIAIQKGEYQKGKQILATCAPSAMGRWLQESYVRSILSKHPKLSEELQARYTSELSVRTEPTSVMLLQAADWMPDAEQIRGWLESGLGKEITLLGIASNQPEHIALKATMDDGMEILISICSAEVEYYCFSEAVAYPLRVGTKYVVQIGDPRADFHHDIEYRQKQLDRLWAVVRSAVGDQTLAVYQEDQGLLWTKERSDLTQVGGQTPIYLDRKAYQNVQLYVVHKTDDQRISADELLVVQSSGMREALVNIRVHCSVETLQCHLVGKSDSQDTYKVRLRERSLLYPDIVPEAVVEVPISWIQIAR